MPLDNYGVLVGTLIDHHRDTPDDQGRWFHVNLEVAGATLVRRSDGQYDAFLSKFTSQSGHTDDHGHPIR